MPCCINDLQKIPDGELDPKSLREGIDECFGLNSKNGNNNSKMIP
jgi:hypothetical protein